MRGLVAVISRKPSVSLRPSSVRQIQSFQELGEPAVSPERAKKRLDPQQVNEVCLVLDRFIKALKCEIEVSHSDGSECLCQGCDVARQRAFTKLFDTFVRSRQAALPSVRCREDTDIH